MQLVPNQTDLFFVDDSGSKPDRSARLAEPIFAGPPQGWAPTTEAVQVGPEGFALPGAARAAYRQFGVPQTTTPQGRDAGNAIGATLR
jgi:hypothetical protein